MSIDFPAAHESETELSEDHSSEEASAKQICKSDRTNSPHQQQMFSLASMTSENKQFKGILKLI